MEQEKKERLPLGQVEDTEELKRRYRLFDCHTLERWAALVVGPHHDAMAAVLRERAGRRES